MITVSISIERIKEQIYALSALRTYINKHQRPLSLLTADQSEGLQQVVMSGLSSVIMNLGELVREMEYDGADYQGATMVSLCLGVTMPGGGEMLARAVEAAVMHSSMAIIFEGTDSDAGCMYQQRAAVAIDNIRYLATVSDDGPIGSIIAHR